MDKQTVDIIYELWSSKEEPKKVIFTPYDNYELTASLDNTKSGMFDLMLSDSNEGIGFIILEKFKRGDYLIVGDYTGHHKHRGFEERSGIGLEVKPDYRRRGFASALISLGIGIAGRDFEEYKNNLKEKISKASEDDTQGRLAEAYAIEPNICFSVKVCNLISEEDKKLFEKNGFCLIKNRDESGKLHTEAIYDRHDIPEISIKPPRYETSLAVYDENFAKLPI